MQRRITITLICLIPHLLLTTVLGQLTEGDERFIRALMAENKIPGVSIAVVLDNEIQYARGFGVKNSQTQEEVSTETLFQAASISKSVASILYLRNIQEGIVALDSLINSYLQTWKLSGYKKEAYSSATVRQLLSHTGGVNRGGFLGYSKIRKRIPTLDQVLQGKHVHFWETRIKSKYPPNEAFRYAGGGYCVLEKALCEVQEESFDQLAQTYVFKPCQMENSFYSYSLTQSQEMNASKGHKKNGKLIKGTYHVYPQMAAAGLWTTPSDLAKFLIEIQNSFKEKSPDPLLSKEARTELLAFPQFTNDQPTLAPNN
ncbi:MAG: serine hydrolase domain-containing protein [Bacteroidota bacterium]